MAEKIRVIIAEPGKFAKEAMVDNDFRAFQKVVGGYIEIAPFNFGSHEISAVCNDEGKINRLPPNRVIYDSEGHGFDFVAGPILVVGTDYETGESRSLTDDEIEDCMYLIGKPQICLGSPDGYETVEMDEEFDVYQFYGMLDPEEEIDELSSIMDNDEMNSDER